MQDTWHAGQQRLVFEPLPDHRRNHSHRGTATHSPLHDVAEIRDGLGTLRRPVTFPKTSPRSGYNEGIPWKDFVRAHDGRIVPRPPDCSPGGSTRLFDPVFLLEVACALNVAHVVSRSSLVRKPGPQRVQRNRQSFRRTGWRHAENVTSKLALARIPKFIDRVAN